MRRIAHLDMDAFFASVELLHYPELKGLPVVVGGRSATPPNNNGTRHFPRLAGYTGRGVVTTSTYEARALGVFSGMGLMKSAKLAPQAILLPANFDAYRHYSKLFKSAVKRITPIVEDRGIDEIYIDLTDEKRPSQEIAHALKQAVFAATGLTCSIAITPNKLLAKIGSDLQKPDGVTILTDEDIETRIWPLAVSKINGIGPKAKNRLESLGVTTIFDLAHCPLDSLVSEFGQHTGQWLHDSAHGIDHRPVITEHQTKSVSRESTFEQDLHVLQDRAKLSQHFSSLCMRVAHDLSLKQLAGKTIGIKLRYANFESVTRDITLAKAINTPEDILAAARQCLKRVPFPQKIRLLGVRVSGLEEDAPSQAKPAFLQLTLPLSD